jgi:hypothetical protein
MTRSGNDSEIAQGRPWADKGIMAPVVMSIAMLQSSAFGRGKADGRVLNAEVRDIESCACNSLERDCDAGTLNGLTTVLVLRLRARVRVQEHKTSSTDLLSWVGTHFTPLFIHLERRRRTTTPTSDLDARYLDTAG